MKLREPWRSKKKSTGLTKLVISTTLSLNSNQSTTPAASRYCKSRSLSGNYLDYLRQYLNPYRSIIDKHYGIIRDRSIKSQPSQIANRKPQTNSAESKKSRSPKVSPFDTHTLPRPNSPSRNDSLPLHISALLSIAFVQQESQKMGDKHLNELLRWSIENTATGPDGTTNDAPRSTLNPEMLAALMGGPSDADLMRESMSAIVSTDPEITLESKLIAFDNLEQLIESLDNANLLSKLGLWTPLLDCLAHAEAEIRVMAAWCVGTAVQNNEPCQERLVGLGGVERLVRMAVGKRLPQPTINGEAVADTTASTTKTEENKTEEVEEETKTVRRKAIYALSSAVRNYQPAMDVCAAELRRQGQNEHVGGGDDGKSIDATDMDAVDAVINGLREKVTSST